jgi:hypothetical protein
MIVICKVYPGRSPRQGAHHREAEQQQTYRESEMNVSRGRRQGRPDLTPEGKRIRKLGLNRERNTEMDGARENLPGRRVKQPRVKEGTRARA